MITPWELPETCSRTIVLCLPLLVFYGDCRNLSVYTTRAHVHKYAYTAPNTEDELSVEAYFRHLRCLIGLEPFLDMDIDRSRHSPETTSL